MTPASSRFRQAQLASRLRQSARRAPLDDLARAMGWQSWSDYETACKSGAVTIADRPDGWVSQKPHARRGSAG